MPAYRSRGPSRPLTALAGVAMLTAAGAAAAQPAGQADTTIRPLLSSSLSGPTVLYPRTEHPFPAHGPSPGSAIAAAVDFGNPVQWRGELELAFRDARPERDRDPARVAHPGQVHGGYATFSALSPTGLMANGIVAFDSGTGHGQFYVGGGLGLTLHSAALQGAEADGGPGVEDQTDRRPRENAPPADHDRFAYQLMTGLVWPFADGADITLRYRFRSATGDRAAEGGGTEETRSHSFAGGIMIRF